MNSEVTTMVRKADATASSGSSNRRAKAWRMGAKTRKLLDEAARLMLGEAQARGSDRIYSASGFAREHISIVHQQLRCANLAWALGHSKRVRPGDVVGIIGGSFSGLALAVSIAVTQGAIVYIFEKEKQLLRRFLDKGHRHLSPNLNTRYLGKRFDPTSSSPFFEPPIFRWKSGIASSVAHQWLNEFDGYQRKLPIFSFFDWEVKERNIKRRSNGVTINPEGRSRAHIKPIEVDLLVDATGFGEETNPHSLVDFSYWESGHRLIYDHLPNPCSVLVSGCGDSGLIEAMHYAIGGFNHKLVEKLWPRGANLERTLDLGLETATLDEVLSSREIERYDNKVISELCWWLDTWFRLENWTDHGWSFTRDGAHSKPIFEAIEKVVQPRLQASFPRRDIAKLEWDEREKFVTRLPLKVQLDVREAVRPLADKWSSRSIEKLAKSIDIAKLFRLPQLHNRARPGVTVTLNGTTPTPYTRQLSTYNVWLMRVLTSFPNVRYLQGRVSEVRADRNGGFAVTFNDGKQRKFDRVVSRYGPGNSGSRTSLASRKSRDPHAGSWLLTPVSYSVPTDREDIYRRVNPAVDRVKTMLRKLEARRPSSLPASVDKHLYKAALLLGPADSMRSDPIYQDPQA